MARKLVVSYTFNHATKQVSILDYASPVLANILLIVDVTNGATIYQPNNPSLLGTLSGQVLTLAYDTTGSGFANTDSLEIFYEDPTVVQPISATSLPLPTGAATAANQSTENSLLTDIKANTANPPVKLQDGAGNNITSSANGFQRSLDVQLHDNSGNAFQGQQVMASSLPVVIASNQSTLPVSAASLPLPTGAATSALQSSIITALGSPFQAGGSIGNTSFGISGTLPAFAVTPTVNLGTLNGAATAANQSTEITALNQIHTDLIAALPAGSNTIGSVNILGGNATAVKVDGSAVTQPISGSVSISGTPTVSGAVTANAGTNLNTSALALESGGNLASINTKLPGLGQALSSASQPTVIASDQSQLKVIPGQPVMVGQPASNSIAATGTIQFSVQGGTVVALTLTNAPGATATWVGTVQFQWSPDGTNWNTLTANPKSGIPVGIPVTQSTAPGLWLANLPVTAAFVRYNVSAWTSGTIYGFCEAWGQTNSRIYIPFTPSVTGGAFPLGPIDCSGIASIIMHISAATTTQLIAEGTNDPTGTTWSSIAIQDMLANTSFGGFAAVYSNPIQFNPGSYKYCRIRISTGGTVLTIQGVSAILGQTVTMSAYGNSMAVNTFNAGVNLSQISGSTPNTNAVQGSSNKSLSVYGNGVTNSTLTTTAFAGNGATNGATQAIADGGGAAASFDINVSTLTLGTASSVLFSIETSYDNGTTYSTKYTTQPVTTTGHIRIPAINLDGRLRMRAWSVGGTSTTVTTATNIMEQSTPALIQAQGVDVYSATNPFTANINGTAYASTLVSTTLSSTSAPCIIEGCKVITISGVFTGGTPTTAPVYALQISQDLTNWFTTSTTITPSAAGMFAATLNGVSARYARLIVTTASSGGTPYGVTYTAINGTN